MSVQINKLVKSLLQKESLDECSVSELKQFADRHPYFGAAQLLLTKKLQTENHEQYIEQLQKTFLFFHNPLWVEQLLNETRKAIINSPEKVVDEKIFDFSVVDSEKTESEIIDLQFQNKESAPANTLPDIPTLKSQDPEPEKDELIFEPFHTVDYFASQGIKFREEEHPKDKFGKQLKSFTAWLKTMKRLPATEVSNIITPNTEQKVEQLAEHSLTDREILTETMAEVWIKQGNTQKATEIYSKLSLLDPSKSFYFASKIEELKKRF
ncbi:MAG: hypothetical protein ACRDEB_08885 [Chitinophagaceae bacterium]